MTFILRSIEWLQSDHFLMNVDLGERCRSYLVSRSYSPIANVIELSPNFYDEFRNDTDLYEAVIRVARKAFLNEPLHFPLDLST